ncbi:MAG: DUF6152 family protein [Gammaproteobacteria bacterium]|nr:DUF6152 family protein [Gammaproteobacteria bacterium]
MRARRIAAPVFLAAAIALIPLSKTLAHHGDAGRYEETITTLSGTVVALQLINPHSLLIFDVVDEATGQSVRWQAEISNANGLARIGWTRDTLKPGDLVTMSGRVLKSGAPYINLSERSRLTRTDTCEELYYSGMIFGEPPDYPAPTCD